jgi:hypothetical protein
MPLREARSLAIPIAIVIWVQVACNSATAPSPLPPGYVGEWTGTTTEGTPVQFSVSPGDYVTSFVLTYNFSAACSGTLTNTDLGVPIHYLDPPGPPPYDQPGFTFGTNDGTSATAIGGHFSPDRRSASGQFVLVRYGACGDVALGKWSARRR